jgi:uncharacterized protein (DUF1015 family)
MADIRPFYCLRPPTELVDKVSELPYDVCSTEEARIKAADNPYNFYNISKPEITLPEDTDPYSEAVYNRGRENLDNFSKRGYLVDDDTPSFFLYTLVMNGRSQTGLVCVVSIDDYTTGVVKTHEFTRKAKEADRIRHIETLGAQTGPVFLMFNQNEEVKSLFSDALTTEILYDFTADDGVRHIVRRINDERYIGHFRQVFTTSDLYIADGHHRAASAVIVGKKHRDEGLTDGSDFFLAVLFPDEELLILPYNRALKDLNGLTPDSLIEKLEENFTVEKSEVKSPEKPFTFSMYLENNWYLLTPKFEVPKGVVESLDVQVLQNSVLTPIFNIEDPRTSERIDFIGGIRGTAELEKIVDNGQYKIAFSMYPTSIEQLMQVSDTGSVMPPKSTWFEPKLRSGLFVHRFRR